MSKEKYRLVRGRHPFVTVEEMRRDPALQFPVEPSERGGARFEGSTTPELVEPSCPKDAPVLELGPVYGHFTAWLLDHGYTDVHTLDFVDMLSAADRARVTARAIDPNVEPFPYANGFFGSGTAWGFMEHLENPHHVIREAHRVLADGGVWLVSLPNVLHLKSRLKLLRDGIFPRWNVKDNHIALFPHGVFEKSFLRHFDLVEVRYTRPNWNLYDNTPSRWLPANEWFGNYVVYVLRKKPFVPYA